MGDQNQGNHRRRQAGREKEPPIFHGTSREDVMGWLRKYRETAEYNFWTPEESLQHFKWSLEDLARDWFDSLDPVPADFEQLATAITLAFKRPAYEAGLSSQLRTRRQGVGESPVAYCYAMLALCRKVDPNMGVGEKIQFLINGMNSTMVDRIFPFINFQAPDVQAFIELVKLHDRASWVAQTTDWATENKNKGGNNAYTITSQGTNGQGHSHDISGQGPSQENRFVTREELSREMMSHRKEVSAELVAFKKGLTSDLTKELDKQLISFRETIADSTKKTMETVGKNLLKQFSGQFGGTDFRYPGKRTVDGR